MIMAVNPDLQKERDSATFDSNQLTFVLDGGEDVTKHKRAVGKQIAIQSIYLVTYL